MKKNYKHGLHKHPLYKTYYNIIGRCNNPNMIRYERYGGRGIKVCDEWLNGFLYFYKWAIENGYEEGLSIERVNVNGNYEPSNCIFIPIGKQSSNTTRNIRITHNGETKLFMEWCKKLGIRETTIISRVKQRKISYYDALFNYSPYQKNDKTHCKNGHEYKDGSYFINKEGYRVCNECYKKSREKANEQRRLKRKHEKKLFNFNSTSMA